VPPVLVERERATLDLERLLDGVAAGRGGFLWLQGDAGTGKTEIVRLATAAAADRGLRVVRAAGEEGRVEEPFGVATRLLRDVLDGAGPDLRAAVLSGAAAPMAALASGSGLPPDGPSVVNAAAWAIANLAELEPLVLLVDDAHWGDAASLRFLRRLAAWLSDLPVGLVVSTRPDAEGLAGQALAALRGAGPGDEHILGPLTAEGVATVVRATTYPDADDALCAACAAATGGTPLLLHELLATLTAAGVAAHDAAGRMATLEADSPAVALARLPADATATAEALAILGADASTARLATLTGHDETRVAADLDQLRSAGLVARAPSPAFAHALLRAAVASRIPPARRGALHAQAAGLLDAEGEAPSHVATHLLASPPGSTPRSVEILLEVAREANTLAAPECGVPALRRALEEPLAPDRRAEVLLALARAEAAAGIEDAGARFDEAAVLLPTATERARCLTALGEWHTARGRTHDGVAAFDRALAELGDDHRELSRSIEGTRLSAATLDVRLRPLVRERTDALSADPPTEPTPGERNLLAMLSWEQSLAGVPFEGPLRLARTALDEGRLLADETSEGLSVYVCTGTLLMSDALLEETAVLDAALADSRARGSIVGFANASYCRGWPSLKLGRIDEAIADFELALGTVPHGWETFAPVARAGLCHAVLERSGPQAALDVLGLEEMRRYDTTVMWPNVLIAAASARQALGDHEAALALAAEAGSLLASFGWSGPGYAGWRLLIVTSAAALGDRGRAAEVAEEDLVRARRFGASRAIARALRGAALLATGARRVELLTEAVAVLEPSEGHLQRAYATVELGRAQHAAGDVATAREVLRRGLDAADRLGARTLADAARRDLVAAGGRPRRARLTGPASLTPAERRVATMAADGLSNRDIAQALWVTVKAVEFNLSRAYAKLGVRGREQLTAALAAD